LSTWLQSRFVRPWVWEQSRLHVLGLGTYFFSQMRPRGPRSGSEPWGLGSPSHPLAHRGAWRLAAQGGKGELCTALRSTLARRGVCVATSAVAAFVRKRRSGGEAGEGGGAGEGRGRRGVRTTHDVHARTHAPFGVWRLTYPLLPGVNVLYVICCIA
jgi:hypothetical protein